MIETLYRVADLQNAAATSCSIYFRLALPSAHPEVLSQNSYHSFPTTSRRDDNSVPIIETAPIPSTDY